MREYIAFDSHKRYTWVEREETESGRVAHSRLEHAPGAIRSYLGQCEPGTAVAVEATGNWYGIVEEIEQAGMPPLRLAELVRITPPMQWLETLPGIGVILAATIELEIGDIARFPSALHLTSYAGTTPRVHASGGMRL